MPKLRTFIFSCNGINNEKAGETNLDKAPDKTDNMSEEKSKPPVKS